MFFKNAKVYTCPARFQFDLSALEIALSDGVFKPCGSLQIKSRGWVKPLGKHGEMFTHVSGDCFMITQRVDEKKIPASAVNRKLQERVEEIEEKEGRKLTARDKKDLKFAIIQGALPKTLPGSTLLYAYVNMKHNYIVIDSKSPGKCEELISHLRESLGSFPVTPLQTNKIPGHTMTGWFKAHKDLMVFDLGNECILQNQTYASNIARFKNHDLLSDEVLALIDQDFMIKECKFNYNDRIQFVLDENLVIKKIYLMDIVKDISSDSEAEDAAQQFDADFTIMVGEFHKLITRIIDEFGGLLKQDITDSEQSEITGLNGGGLNMEEISKSGDPVSEYQKQAIMYILANNDASVEGLCKSMECDEEAAKGFLKIFEGIGLVSSPDESGDRTVLEQVKN